MSVDYNDIKSAIAQYIGTPEPRWDSPTAATIERCITRGMDKVVHNGEHQWSWARPAWKWQTASGQRRYTLPPYFEQFVPDFICFDGDDSEYGAISQLPVSRLMLLQSDSTGTPRAYAIESPAHDGTTPQEKQLVLHPTPGNTYSLVGVYQIGITGGLSDSRPHPPGGPEHGELFRSACLAMTEAEFRDGEIEKRTDFADELARHINIDLRKAPRNLGYMGGQRGGPRGRADARRLYNLVSGPTTYEGSYDL